MEQVHPDWHRRGHPDRRPPAAARQVRGTSAAGTQGFHGCDEPPKGILMPVPAFGQ